jgi:type II secretory ATPase GspE/PulE/Tfp pilus assembly ATPase PilB-like protein
MQLHMEVRPELAPAGDSLKTLGMTRQLRTAVSWAWTRPCGLMVISGPGAEDTAATIQAETRGATIAAPLADRASATAAVDAAEHGRVIAIAAESDAITTILALRRQAADRFALAATLRMVIAQRVVPGLCGDCREPVQSFGSASALLGLDPGTILWHAAGCPACGETGEAGVVRVFEGIEVDAAMRRLIYDGADAPLLARHAFLAAPNIASAARTLAREGRIGPDRAARLSRS